MINVYLKMSDLQEFIEKVATDPNYPPSDYKKRDMCFGYLDAPQETEIQVGSTKTDITMYIRGKEDMVPIGEFYRDDAGEIHKVDGLIDETTCDNQYTVYCQIVLFLALEGSFNSYMDGDENECLVIEKTSGKFTITKKVGKDRPSIQAMEDGKKMIIRPYDEM